jgi:hypothetical protein
VQKATKRLVNKEKAAREKVDAQLRAKHSHRLLRERAAEATSTDTRRTCEEPRRQPWRRDANSTRRGESSRHPNRELRLAVAAAAAGV